MAGSRHRTKTARIINAEESVRYYLSLEGKLRKGDAVATRNNRREFVIQARGGKVITLYEEHGAIERKSYTLGVDDGGRYMEVDETQFAFSGSKEYSQLRLLLDNLSGGYKRT